MKQAHPQPVLGLGAAEPKEIMEAFLSGLEQIVSAARQVHLLPVAFFNGDAEAECDYGRDAFLMVPPFPVFAVLEKEQAKLRVVLMNGSVVQADGVTVAVTRLGRAVLGGALGSLRGSWCMPIVLAGDESDRPHTTLLTETDAFAASVSKSKGTWLKEKFVDQADGAAVAEAGSDKKFQLQPLLQSKGVGAEAGSEAKFQGPGSGSGKTGVAGAAHDMVLYMEDQQANTFDLSMDVTEEFQQQAFVICQGAGLTAGTVVQADGAADADASSDEQIQLQ
ncbi:unnamed protein product, partial [Prorocentrum cordatum]